MRYSPGIIALIAAAVVAAIVAYVLRPAQLSVHPAGPPAVTPAPPAQPAPIRARRLPLPLVYVAGAVTHPGVYAIAADARARDALAAAGGATRDADLVAVNLAAHVADGDEIAVPHLGEARAPATRSVRGHGGAGGAHRRRPRRRAERGGGAERSTAETPSSSTQTVDLNTASVEELTQLPGIGPALAARIVEFRTLNGPFVSVDGLADVAGITAARLDELAPLVSVDPAAP